MSLEYTVVLTGPGPYPDRIFGPVIVRETSGQKPDRPFKTGVDAGTWLRGNRFGKVHFDPELWWPMRGRRQIQRAHRYCMDRYAPHHHRVGDDWEVLCRMIRWFNGCPELQQERRRLFFQSPDLFWYYFSPFVLRSCMPGRYTVFELRN